MFFGNELERIQKSVDTLECLDNALINLGFVINQIENSKSESRLITTSEKEDFENIKSSRSKKGQL